MDLLRFCSVLCLLCLCARLFICALWSPAWIGVTSRLSFVVSTVSLSQGQVWYLIVSIPDLCTLTYLELLSFEHYVKYNYVALSKVHSSFPSSRGTQFPTHLFFHTFCPYLENLLVFMEKT